MLYGPPPTAVRYRAANNTENLLGMHAYLFLGMRANPLLAASSFPQLKLSLGSRASSVSLQVLLKSAPSLSQMPFLCILMCKCPNPWSSEEMDSQH
jgi:hypothetical protein